MLAGYEVYRVEKGISSETLGIELELIKTFLQFVNQRYGKQIEPHELRPADVRAFWIMKRPKG